MKKNIYTLFCLFIVLTSQAQTGHLKFMGIPLDGTIDQFQTKLMTKGVKLDAELNIITKEEGSPYRYFKGPFTGKQSSIKIKYNPKTKIVWGAMVVIEYPNEEHVNSALVYYKDKIIRKYNVDGAKNTVKSGYPTYMIPIYDSKDFYGFIYLYKVRKSEFSDEACLIFNYKDYKNTEASEKEDLDDL